MGEFLTFSHLFTEKNLLYFWFVAIALWGGTANYLSRIKRGKCSFSTSELFGEWCISGFAGVLSWLIASELEFSWQLTAFLTGISGHMGARAIYIFEQYLEERFFKYFKNKK